MPEPWRLSADDAMKLSRRLQHALASGWTPKISRLTCHEDRTASGTRPRSLHGAF